jgi:hypothetical protein
MTQSGLLGLPGRCPLPGSRRVLSNFPRFSIESDRDVETVIRCACNPKVLPHLYRTFGAESKVITDSVAEFDGPRVTEISIIETVNATTPRSNEFSKSKTCAKWKYFAGVVKICGNSSVRWNYYGNRPQQKMESWITTQDQAMKIRPAERLSTASLSR